MKKKTDKTTKVSFVDKNRQRFNCEIEITYRNGYKEFSMSSDSGQGKFVPANEPQTKLLRLWDTYHLNGMNAGTVEQSLLLKSEEFEDFKKSYLEIHSKKEKALKKAKNDLEDFYAKAAKNKAISRYVEKEFKKKIADAQKDFDFVKDTDHHTIACNFLLKKDKLEVPHPETGKPYKYGSEWLQRKLPANIDTQISTIVQQVIAAEKDRKGESLKDMDDAELINLIGSKTPFDGRDLMLCTAFVRMFDLTEDDFEDIVIDGTRCRVQGIDYMAGTDAEMDEEWDRDLENYIDDCLEIPKEMERYFDRDAWKAEARIDGRAHSLSRYDGNELSVKVERKTYYAYRQ